MNNTIRIWGLVIVCFVFLFVVVRGAEANTAPNAPSIVGPGEGSTEAEYGFNISASDPDLDQVVYLVDWESDGVVDYESDLFNSGTIKLITHSFPSAGTFTIDVKARDAFGAQSSSTIFSITISRVNNLPVLSPIGDQTIFENQKASFGVSATDPDGDTISYSISDLPNGATYTQKTFEERIFYLFEWVPSDEQSGVYTVAFTVNDGKGGSDFEAITITVKNIKLTKDATSPVIGTVNVLKATESSVVIYWTTNEKVVGMIEYGRLSAFNKSSGFTGTYATSSEQTLSGLDAGAIYQYRLIVKDESGNEARSVNKSFTTISQKAADIVKTISEIEEGNLIRETGKNAVYVIHNGKRAHVASSLAFKERGYLWEDIKEVDASVFAVYDQSPILLQIAGDVKVYQIINNRKRHIRTAQIFSSLSFDWGDIIKISNAEMAAYPEVYLMRAEGDEKIYYITGSGYKKWIRTVAIFNSYNNKWEDVDIMKQEDLDIYPDVSLIRLEGGSKVYSIQNNTNIKTWVHTAEEFLRLGYKWEDVIMVNKIEFDFYKEI